MTPFTRFTTNTTLGCKKYPDFKYFLIFLQFCNIFITLIGIFVSWNGFSHFTIRSTSFFLAFSVGTCILMKFSKVFADRKWKLEELARCQRDLLMGYGLMMVCGVVPQILVMFVERKHIRIETAIICNLTPIAVFLLFIYPNFKNYKIKHRPSIPRVIVIIFHCLFLLVSMEIFKKPGIHRKWTYKKNIFVIQLIYTIMFSFCSAEFFAIFINGVSMATEEEERSLNNPAPRYAVVPQDTVGIKIEEETILREHGLGLTGSECNICLLTYSNQVIPRILVSCGHTVCQGCIEKLPRQEGQVQCPFCRKPTRLPDGQPCQLPKNYAILDMIQELEH